MLLADFDNFKIGCVLLQAAYGCSPDLVYKFGFDTKTWDICPTPTQRLVEGTEEQWTMFAAMCNEKHAKDRNN